MLETEKGLTNSILKKVLFAISSAKVRSLGSFSDNIPNYEYLDDVR